jgi:hypothetical protein
MKTDDFPRRRRLRNMAGLRRFHHLSGCRCAGQRGHRVGALYCARRIHQPGQRQRLLLTEVLLAVLPRTEFFVGPFPQQGQTLSTMQTPHR